MINNKLLVAIYWALAFFTLLSYSSQTLAQRISRSSFLCDQKNLFTMIVFSTEEYNIAICKNGDNSDYFYAGQNKKTNAQTFLLVNDKNDPYSGANPWVLKAVKGEYTYQVAEFNPLTVNGYVFISIFKNGKKIYHRKVTRYIRADE
jgi:hypothetical protein